jgi:murein DD-endopeptidase MepM/ murein hydrolase activator NlpD
VGGEFLKYPLEFTRISSVFTRSRFHPILKVKRPHLGVDFAAPLGTPVRAVAPGKVVSAGYRRDAGYYVKIAHKRPFATSYSHLKRIAKGIRRGRWVEVGEVIGFLGSTGWSTGPHLHYALYKGRRYINPLAFDNRQLVGDPPPARRSAAAKRRPKKWPAGATFAAVKRRLMAYLESLDGAAAKPVAVSLALPGDGPTVSAQGG